MLATFSFIFLTRSWSPSFCSQPMLQQLSLSKLAKGQGCVWQKPDQQVAPPTDSQDICHWETFQATASTFWLASVRLQGHWSPKGQGHHRAARVPWLPTLGKEKNWQTRLASWLPAPSPLSQPKMQNRLIFVGLIQTMRHQCLMFDKSDKCLWPPRSSHCVATC